MSFDSPKHDAINATAGVSNCKTVDVNLSKHYDSANFASHIFIGVAWDYSLRHNHTLL